MSNWKLAEGELTGLPLCWALGESLLKELKYLPEMAYGVYTAAVTLSLGSALYIYFRLSQSIDEIVSGRHSQLTDTLTTTFSQLSWSAFFIATTMVGGLLVVMPIIRFQAATVKQEEQRADKLAIEAITDPLTGLYNRRYFESVLSEFHQEFKRIDKPLGLLILDLDHFKNVNDNHGHVVGDIVLKEVANLLKKLVREHDVVARIGGEEFAVIAPFASENQIEPFAERFCRAIGKLKIKVDNVIIQPTVSIGVAISSQDVMSDRDLIRKADRCLYEAKHRGRNQVCA
jgi:diguanylate cyclase (GGDEF)-like protein